MAGEWVTRVSQGLTVIHQQKRRKVDHCHQPLGSWILGSPLFLFFISGGEHKIPGTPPGEEILVTAQPTGWRKDLALGSNRHSSARSFQRLQMISSSILVFGSPLVSHLAVGTKRSGSYDPHCQVSTQRLRMGGSPRARDKTPRVSSRHWERVSGVSPSWSHRNSSSLVAFGGCYLQVGHEVRRNPELVPEGTLGETPFMTHRQIATAEFPSSRPILLPS